MRHIKGTIHKGAGGYAIVANDHLIFAFGRTAGDAHVRYVRACNTYFSLGLDAKNTGKARVSKGAGEPIDQVVLV